MPRIKGAAEKINGWNVQKKNNSPAAMRAKIEIRERVLAAIGAENAAVWDAYAGAGVMHAAVWHKAKHYMGCEQSDWYPNDRRLAYVGDNRRVMRCIDLGQFNLFDYDAYGSPWEPVYLMVKRRPVAPGERIGVVLTEGQGMKMDMGGMSAALAALSGVRQYMSGLGAQQQFVIDRAVRRMAEMMACQIESHWQAKSKHSSTIRYIGVVMTGLPLEARTSDDQRSVDAPGGGPQGAGHPVGVPGEAGEHQPVSG